MNSKVKDQKSKVLILSAFFLVLAFLIGGCTWGKREAAGDQLNPVITPGDQVTTESLGGTGETGSIKLTNIRELPVSSEGMAASGFDGPVTWSRDGQHVAIQMSNLTAASTQVQIVNVASGQREAVVGGYNLHWDEASPESIIFTQHQYYGEPDYGSHEVILKVSQSDLFKTGVFNEKTVPSEVVGDSAGQEEVMEEQLNRGDEISLEQHTPDGKYSFFTKETLDAQPLFVFQMESSSGQAQLLTSADSIIGSFAISADGRKILYQKIQGQQDEFGNWAVTGDQVKFYIADINY